MRPLIVVALVAATAVTPAMRLRAQTGGGAGRDAAVPFKVGERLTYDVTWSAFLVAGTTYATVAIARLTEGKPQPTATDSSPRAAPVVIGEPA